MAFQNGGSPARRGDDGGASDGDLAGPLITSDATATQAPNQERVDHRDQPGHGCDRRPASTVRVEPVPLASIKDGGAQMRVEMRPETVNDYANDMLDGAVFPAIVVFHDGSDFWLAEGFHRVEAARKIGRETINAEIREGSARDAILYGAGANATHGLRRTQADKRRAIERLLKDPEWARWSDRKIAEHAKVDHKTVAVIRRQLAGEFPTGTLTPKGNGGEFSSAKGMTRNRGSVLDAVLRNVPDDVLIAECRRRGLTVEAGDA
jgi:ParB-like nuclease domain